MPTLGIGPDPSYRVILGGGRVDSAALVRFLVGDELPDVIAEGLASDEAEHPLVDRVTFAGILRDFGIPVRGARLHGRWRTSVWGWIVAAEPRVPDDSAAPSYVFLCPDGRLLRVSSVHGRLVAERTGSEAATPEWEPTPLALLVAREWLIHHIPLEPWVPVPRQPSAGS